MDSDEGQELLVNLKNHKRAERPLAEDIIAVRGQLKLAGEERAELDSQRAAAMARLRERAQEDEAVADLLLVLGLAE